MMAIRGLRLPEGQLLILLSLSTLPLFLRQATYIKV